MSADRFSLRRWSEQKRAAARAASAPAAASEPAVEAAPAPPIDPPAAPLPTAAPLPRPGPAASPELPPVESLTFDSDFSAFLQPKVGEGVKRAALKKLFADPRFNVMDGLDVYIDDYSVPSPLEPELVAQLLHARMTLNPPETRVNEAGCVEEVPPTIVAGDGGDGADGGHGSGRADGSDGSDGQPAALPEPIAAADAPPASLAVPATPAVPAAGSDLP